MHPFFSGPRPRVFAHRGASGDAPENTLEAFERALRQGATHIETDCHASADGHLVLIHDGTVERTTDGEGPVSELSITRLTALDAGYHFTPDGGSFPFRGCDVRIPRLSDALETFPTARFNVELKPREPALAQAAVDLVRRVGAEERVLLTSAHDEVGDELHALQPATALGASVGEILRFFRAVLDKQIDKFERRAHALQIPPSFAGQTLVTQESVDLAHRSGMEVHVWTINDPAEMRRLFELGVDGLMSDFPSRLAEVARQAAV